MPASSVQRRPASARGRLVLPVAGAGLLIACGFVLLRGGPEQHTVSEVKRTIRDIALAASAPDAPPGAGEIGPWLIAADAHDPLTGVFTNFHLESGRMVLTARTADLIVDAATDSFTFELHDVVYMRIPDEGKPEEGVESFMHHLDHYRLGPAPYGADIVLDSAAAG
jgi:hypothetical protein